MERLNKNQNEWSDDVSGWEFGNEDEFENTVSQSVIDELNASQDSTELAKKMEDKIFDRFSYRSN